MIRVRVSAVAAAAGLALAVWSPASMLAQDITTKIDIVGNGIGVPPADFEFWRTGDGEAGRWAVVRDATAAASGAAIEQYSTDPTPHRFPLAIYKPMSVKNLEISARFKLVTGPILSAGIALRLASPGTYYVVSASALETRVDLYRVVEDTKERIAGVDADVERNRWHSLQVRADGSSIKVMLDKRLLFTALDDTILRDGHVALWIEEDTVARFDQIEITSLPWSEPR